MCGRYTLTVDLQGVEARFHCGPSGIVWQPHYNLAPTQNGLVVIRADKRNILKEMRWGLVPRWAKDPAMGSRLINARLETLDEKPAFRKSLAGRRCIIPADGFYEWQKQGKSKVPHRFIGDQGRMLGFAGLWDRWTIAQGGHLDTFTIITTKAVDAVKSIHDRMPLILPPDLEEQWLEGPAGPGAEEMKYFLNLMHPELRIHAYRVSPLVNSPSYDQPQCIEEVPDQD
ncbi:MAG TPA: SOS response-associated peptidase [Syntrophomonadaceae bacterium]|nr:SOS response-associated peptidase [Syntrophomonadaceae bacterium]